MKNQNEAKGNFLKAWPTIIKECRQVLGSELHYQAMIYHCLRQKGKVPIDQIGMNVKMWIDDPESQVFKERDEEKNVLFQGGYEPIPDIVLFKPTVNGDWRRRNNQNTLRKMLMAIEVKASENKGGRMSVKTISRDIEKLVALRHEVGCLGASFVPVMLIIDTAPTEKERMTSDSLGAVCEHGKSENINLFYFSSDEKREIAW